MTVVAAAVAAAGVEVGGARNVGDACAGGGGADGGGGDDGGDDREHGDVGPAAATLRRRPRAWDLPEPSLHRARRESRLTRPATPLQLPLL